MSRLPDATRENFPENLKYVWDRSGARRKAGDPGGLVRAMGNNPQALLGYARFGNQLWPHCGVDAPTRELLVLRTSILAGAEYEWHHHVALARRLGVSDDRIVGLHMWQVSELYTPKERLLLAWIDALFANAPPPQSLHDQIELQFGPDALVGVTLLQNYYQGTAKFISVMAVELEEPFVGWYLSV